MPDKETLSPGRDVLYSFSIIFSMSLFLFSAIGLGLCLGKYIDNNNVVIHTYQLFIFAIGIVIGTIAYENLIELRQLETIMATLKREKK